MELPPAISFTDQLTALLVAAPLTVAVKVLAAPTRNVTVARETGTAVVPAPKAVKAEKPKPRSLR